MAKEKVDVRIDFREPSELVEAVSNHDDVDDYTIEDLEQSVGTADLIVQGIGFERKTPSDFAGSVTDSDNHLRDQVERMKETFEQSYVMVEGDLEDFNYLTRTNVAPQALRGFASSIEARNQTVGVKFCSNVDLLVDKAIRLARKHIEDADRNSLTIDTSVTKSGEPFEKRVLGLVENIGAKTADTIYEELDEPTLPELLDTAPSEFTAIDGIGDKTAERIWETIHGEELVLKDA